MKLRQLEYFCAVAEEKSISAAARELHVAQPPISRQIAQLVSRLCARRRLRVSFDSPGQVFIRGEGCLHLVVKTQAQAYQLRNLLPTIQREIEQAFGARSLEVKITVCPSLHDGLARDPGPAGDPRQPNPKAAAAMREKASRLPAGSRLRESLEELARSLEA